MKFGTLGFLLLGLIFTFFVFQIEYYSFGSLLSNLESKFQNFLNSIWQTRM